MSTGSVYLENTNIFGNTAAFVSMRHEQLNVLTLPSPRLWPPVSQDGGGIFMNSTMAWISYSNIVSNIPDGFVTRAAFLLIVICLNTSSVFLTGICHLLGGASRPSCSSSVHYALCCVIGGVSSRSCQFYEPVEPTLIAHF